jgi:hypothetical protein
MMMTTVTICETKGQVFHHNEREHDDDHDAG